MKSKETKHYERASKITGILSFLLLVTPAIIYIIKAFIEGGPYEKLTMGCMVMMAIIFSLVNIIFKMRIRSTIWLLVIGIYICINNILPLIILLAATTIVEEFIISPLHKKYKSKAMINGEIDKRL